MTPPEPRPAITPALVYEDPRAALLWLEEAFGLESSMVILDGEDRVAHAEIGFRGGGLMLGGSWAESQVSPKNFGGRNTQSVHLHLGEGAELVDAHCARARAAGAQIVQEPADQFYGDRSYRAVDPEGHIWSISKTVKVTAPEEWEATMGLKTRTRL